MTEADCKDQHNSDKPNDEFQVNPELKVGERQWSISNALSRIDTSFRNVWFYFAAVALIVNLCWTFRPQLQVQASTTLPENNPISSLFTIINSGPWTLYNMHINCQIFQNGYPIISFKDVSVKIAAGAPSTGTAYIPELPPGRTATRDCVTGLSNPLFRIKNFRPETLRIDLTIGFDWLWRGYAHKPSVFHFDTRLLDGKRYILVPDIEGSLAPPVVSSVIN